MQTLFTVAGPNNFGNYVKDEDKKRRIAIKNNLSTPISSQSSSRSKSIGPRNQENEVHQSA
jgi:hypothetical protein